ncbi:MAG: ABC transporter permease, partial [Candidatus Cryptobacteroides sp.]
MKEILAFIQKEFRHIFRDVRTTLIVLVMPVVQIILFGFALSTEVHNAVVDVVGDLSDPVVRRIVDRMDNNPYLEIGQVFTSTASVNDRLKNGKCSAVVCFAQDFG